MTGTLILLRVVPVVFVVALVAWLSWYMPYGFLYESRPRIRRATWLRADGPSQVEIASAVCRAQERGNARDL